MPYAGSVFSNETLQKLTVQVYATSIKTHPSAVKLNSWLTSIINGRCAILHVIYKKHFTLSSLSAKVLLEYIIDFVVEIKIIQLIIMFHVFMFCVF